MFFLMRPNLRVSSLCEVSVCIGIEPERLEHADSVIKITALILARIGFLCVIN